MKEVTVPGNYESEEFLDRLKKLTEALTPLTDMAILLDMDEMALSELLEDRNSAASKVFRKARAEMRLRIRQMNISQAAAGSSPDMETILRYVAEADL